MSYDPVQCQGDVDLECAKWLISKSLSSNAIHAIKRLMVSYDTPRQYLNFYWIDFWYASSSFGVTWTSNMGPPLGN